MTQEWTAEPEPLDPLSAFYDCERRGSELRLTPLAKSGPGLSGRRAMLAGLGLGLFLNVFALFAWWHLFSDKGELARPALAMSFGLPNLITALALAGAWKLWRTRYRPLTASSSGQLCYGTAELVPPGESRRLHLNLVSQWACAESGPDYEIRTARLYLEREDGRFTELPAPWFSHLDEWDSGEALAVALAAALNVPLSRNALPEGVSVEDRTKRFWTRVRGVFALLIGVPHWMGGYLVLQGHLLALISPALALPDDVPPWWFGLIFAASGGGLCWYGCRCFHGGWRTWLTLLGSLGALVTAVWVSLELGWL